MSTNPLTAPLNETERLAAQESERRAELVRAQSEAVRHLEAAKALQGSAGVPWSPTVVLLGALGIVTIPLAFALYAWAFRWFWRCAFVARWTTGIRHSSTGSPPRGT